MKIVAEHKLVNLFDRACRTVFDGQYAVFAHAGFDGSEHAVEGGEVQNRGDLEHLGCGDLGVRTLHALAGNQSLLGEEGGARGQRCLHLGGHLGGGGEQLCLTGAGELEEGGVEVVGVALPGVSRLFGDFGQNGALPFLVQNGLVVGVFVGRHLIGKGHALQEELQKLVIDLVDLRADLRKFHGFPPVTDLRER